MLSKRFSRREVIKMSGAAAAAALLAACQPKVIEVEKEVTKVVKEVVKETVIVAGTPQLVEKEVTKVVEKEVTKIVEVEKAPAEKVTIGWATPAGLGLERTMYSNFSYKFMEENPSIEVKVNFESWGDHMTKLPTMLAAGVTPEVVHNHWSIAQDYAYNGVFIDVMPYMERDGVDPKEFIDVLLDEYAHGGKQYLLPKDSAVNGVYYNKTMFDEAGVEYPKPDWNMADFVETCKLLTRDENGYPAGDAKFDATKVKQWGYKWAALGPAAGPPTGFALGMGTPWYDEDFTESFINRPEAVEHLQMFADLRCLFHAIPSPGEALGQGDQWRIGLAAMLVGHHGQTFQAKQENVRFDFDVTLIPAGPGGQYSTAGSSGCGLTANAAHRDEGWELLNFLTSEETQAFIGQQKRWGVNRKAIVHTIEPNDGIPEHFAMVHTDPYKVGYAGSVKLVGLKAPAYQSRIKEIFATEFDGILTCGGGDVREAADRAKKQIDEVLAEAAW